jgi:hypothetical protein
MLFTPFSSLPLFWRVFGTNATVLQATEGYRPHGRSRGANRMSECTTRSGTASRNPEPE